MDAKQEAVWRFRFGGLGLLLLLFGGKQALFRNAWVQAGTVGGLLVGGLLMLGAGVSKRYWLGGVGILVIAIASVPTSQYLASQGGYAGTRGEIGLIASVGVGVLGIFFIGIWRYLS